MKTSAKKLPGWGKLIIVFAIILAVLGAFLLGIRVYFRASVSKYYKNSDKGFVIPYLNGGFIPQGIDYAEDEGYFYLTGYRSKGKASPIIIVDKATKKCVKILNMETADGEPFTGHAGGIAVHGDFVYIAGGEEKCVYAFSRNQIKNSADGEGIVATGAYMLTRGEDYILPAFLTVDGDSLIIGEFHREENYKTLPSHHIALAGGGENTALAVAVKFDETKEFGLSNDINKAYSLPSLVQGMCLSGGKVYLSTSYGVKFSNVYSYNVGNAEVKKDSTVMGKSVDLVVFDEKSLIKQTKIAPMSEEIAIVDGKAYVMCEAASNKYKFGKFTSAKYCYATNLEYFG